MKQKESKCKTEFETTDGHCVADCTIHSTRILSTQKFPNPPPQSTAPVGDLGSQFCGTETIDHGGGTFDEKRCNCSRAVIETPLPRCCADVYVTNAEGTTTKYTNNLITATTDGGVPITIEKQGPTRRTYLVNNRRAYYQVGCARARVCVCVQWWLCW